MTQPPRRNHAMYKIAVSDLPYGPGGTFPGGLASDGDVVVVHQYADQPSLVPDGWSGLLVHLKTHTTVESYRNRSLDKVLAWARSLRANKIIIENPATRHFESDPGANPG